jgi:uncharacterized protein
LKKLDRLKKILKNYPGVVVALSGGVDYTLLLNVAREVLHDRVSAVTVVSPLMPRDEIIAAQHIARMVQCEHILVSVDILGDATFIDNPTNRCYYCKKKMFKKIRAIADDKGFVVVEASNSDDRDDYRPGLAALRELRIKSPLIEAGLTKKEIRRLAKKYNLENWNKPAMACLASRIPYNTKIDKDRLKRIERAERYLKRLTIGQVRVRDHYPIARIEVEITDFKKLLTHRARVVRYLKKLGYAYICLDLEGYLTGSLNR